MSSTRIEALERLAESIVCAVPELKGRVCVGQAESSHNVAFPHMVLIAGNWVFYPDQEEHVYEPSPDKLVVNVGRYESRVQIRVGATTPSERYNLEEKITRHFNSTPLHPGHVIVSVKTCADVGDFQAAFFLEDLDWADELAFDSKFYSMISTTCSVPAFGIYACTYRLDSIVLTQEVTGSPHADSPNVSFVIQQDGSVQAL